MNKIEEEKKELEKKIEEQNQKINQQMQIQQKILNRNNEVKNEKYNKIIKILFIIHFFYIFSSEIKIYI